MVRDYGETVSIWTYAFLPSISHLMELVLQLSLRAFRSRTNGLGIISVESSTRLRMVELWSFFIISRNQKRNTKGPAHDALLAVRALAEPQRQITDRLRTALDPQRLVVVEGVVLGLYAGVLDHGARIGLQPRHGASDVAVDLDDLFDGGGFEEGGGDTFLDAEDDTAACCDADGGGAELDGFEGVFDLEETAFW